MSKRTLEELKQEVSKALKFSDAAILMQCAKELKEIGTSKARALCENTFGVANQISGNYREALEHHLKALNLLEELGDRYGVGRTNNSIGNVYSNTGNYPLALEYFHRALALSEDLGDRPGVANVNINLGDLYKRTGHYPQALEHHHRAVALYEELGSRFGVEMATCNIGAIYAEAGSFQQALEFYYRALAMREELGDTRGAAVVTFNIIQALINIASYAEAEALLASMETIQIDNPQVIVVREMSRAAIQEHYEKFDDAMNTLITALETAREHSLARERADIHQQIRDLCQKRNDFAGYIIHNNEFTRIQEEINGRETAIKFTMQEKQREIDAREKEHQKFMAVLHSTLPKHIADRVARGEQVTDHIDDAAVMFVDIVGFTALSSTLTNQQVISLLDALFGICDEACKKNNVTRIKTIGDSYLAVAFPSTTVERDSEANIAGERDSLIETVLKDATQCSLNMANAALEILQRIKAELNDYHPGGGGIRVRIGLHVGPVTAGVLGKERLQYDIWGDTVNVASRMEGSSEPNRIHVTATFAQALQEVTAMRVRHNAVSEHTELPHSQPGTRSIRVEFRGETELKGKGMVKTFWLTAD